MSRLRERLAGGPPIVADGGMGAVIASAVPRLRCPEEANLRAPESVVDVHLGYIRAGAELIETNTFGANRAKLAEHFLEDELEAINAAGARLAREAREVSGRDVFIAGSIGPDSEHGYAQQAEILEGRGVDLFMVETFFDLDDLERAIAAVRGGSSLPVVALMSFDAEAETIAGVSARAGGEPPLASDESGAEHRAHGAAAPVRRRHLRRLRAARSTPRREPRGADRDGAGSARYEQGAVRRRERQPEGARADERDHGVGRHRAVHRRRDDSASDAARHDAHRSRVDPPRRARRGCSERPRCHGRPARGGGLSRQAQRGRRRRDRP